MKNIKLVISYDGGKYNGWQKQGNTSNTIQGKLEENLSKFVGEGIELSGSGRTDAGVHAIAQVANFHVSEEGFYQLYQKYESDDEIRNAFNNFLPKDIKIIKWEEADERFHARLNATGKHYSYRIDVGEIPDIFQRNYTARFAEHLDIDKMRMGAEYFIGEHDFKSFCSNKKTKKSTIRIVTTINLSMVNKILRMDFYGNGFLYNMIRIMVGTLIEVGRGNIQPEDIQTIIEAKDRSCAGFMAPASGLFLEEVYYEKKC